MTIVTHFSNPPYVPMPDALSLPEARRRRDEARSHDVTVAQAFGDDRQGVMVGLRWSQCVRPEAYDDSDILDALRERGDEIGTAWPDVHVWIQYVGQPQRPSFDLMAFVPLSSGASVDSVIAAMTTHGRPRHMAA